MQTRVSLYFAAAALVILCVACRSTDRAPSASLAAVSITGHSSQAIRQATTRVFSADGYEGHQAPSGELIFEKPGSAKDQALYGSWFGEGVWVRVKAKVRYVRPDVYILECDAFVVRDKGQLYFEEEKRIRGRGRFQKLLEESKARVEGGSTEGGG